MATPAEILGARQLPPDRLPSVDRRGVRCEPHPSSANGCCLAIDSLIRAPRP
jgi:hypothetical protein